MTEYAISVFDPPPLKPRGAWPAVWARFDGPNDPEDEDPDADSDLPADSAAALRDAVEQGEQEDLDEAERKDQGL